MIYIIVVHSYPRIKLVGETEAQDVPKTWIPSAAGCINTGVYFAFVSVARSFGSGVFSKWGRIKGGRKWITQFAESKNTNLDCNS